MVDFWKLFKAYREFCPDVIFLQTLLYPCYLAYMLPQKTPIIVTFWNGDVIWWAKSNGIERLFKKWIVTHGAKRAKAITVNSQTAFKACLKYGVTTEKLHLIRYPGVDMDHFNPSVGKEAARSQLGITTRPIVLCPRGIGEYLNSDIILLAAQDVITKYPDVLFLFVSKVGYRKHLVEHQRIVHEQGIAKHFRWEGHVPWEKMPDFYRASDATVSISTNDSLPNCMLESMACGTPVIMGDIPQIREWITDGIEGLLVPTRDPKTLAAALIRILGDQDGIAGRCSQAGLLKVQLEADQRRNGQMALELVKKVATSLMKSKKGVM